MNIAELSIRKRTITLVLTVLLVVVGWKSFNSLPRLEDPEFTIKEAQVVTPYPGASAAEVEEEVTNVIEKACQELGQLWYVESRSARGMSTVKAIMKDRYDKSSLPQVWDELRRKVNDYQRQLPPGAGPSIVNDDFGDVYGVYVAITGEGYTYREVYEYAKFLQRELLPAQDVKRIVFYGQQPEAIYVEMRRDKMAQFGVSQQDIYEALGAKNLVANAGLMKLGPERIPIQPTGMFRSEKEFGELLIKSGTTDTLVYLRDVADIRRDYRDPPETMLRYNGEPAVGLAISTVPGGNVVTMGESLKEYFQRLESMRPVGMELHVICLQTDSVVKAISGFLINLIEAVGIVVIVLLVFMGLRSGLIIGAILVVTIMGTFIVMDFKSVTLERISLGALVIALGMLVDNAIVVTDGMRVKMSQGIDALVAARSTVGQVAVPLLGATLVAIMAFAAIGTSQDSTGEYCRSLFTVILISLLLSWVTAVTCTPLLCSIFLKTRAKGENAKAERDPYDKAFFRGYRWFLSWCIRLRWVTLGVVVVLFVIAVIGFGAVKKSFFPDSTRPQFYVDLWFPEGTDIDEATRQVAKAEKDLSPREGVQNVISFVGGGQIRFLLTYTPEMRSRAFAQILVEVDDYRRISTLSKEVQADLEELLPQAVVNVRLFVLGPSSGGKMQLRLYGPDAEELRRLANRAQTVLEAEPQIKAVRNEWRNRVKVVRPQMADAQARRAGIDRQDVALAMQSAFEGAPSGLFREGDELIPILARAPKEEREDLDNLDQIQVWSSLAESMIPIGQVVKGFRTEFEDPFLWRRDRMKMLRLHADPRWGLPSEAFVRVKAKIEQALNVDVATILGKTGESDAGALANFDASTLTVQLNDKWPLKGMPGYWMAWGGEAEDSAKANSRLSGSLPVFFGLMVLMVLVLFNSIRKTLAVWFVVPLSLIGVAAGLLLLNQPFGFMALLGLMSLSGMLIKNAIVLIDEINAQLDQGTVPFQAIVNSGTSRLIPVMMAAMTTVLGMAPLLQDAFFIAMAVTIMFGLSFATVLTLVVVPVFYATLFRVGYEKP